MYFFYKDAALAGYGTKLRYELRVYRETEVAEPLAPSGPGVISQPRARSPDGAEGPCDKPGFYKHDAPLERKQKIVGCHEWVWKTFTNRYRVSGNTNFLTGR